MAWYFPTIQLNSFKVGHGKKNLYSQVSKAWDYVNLYELDVVQATNDCINISYEDEIRQIHGWKFKIFKILNLRKSEFKTCCMPPKYQKFQIQWSNTFRQTGTKSEKLLLPAKFSILMLTFYGKSSSKSWMQE